MTQEQVSSLRMAMQISDFLLHPNLQEAKKNSYKDKNVIKKLINFGPNAHIFDEALII